MSRLNQQTSLLRCDRYVALPPQVCPARGELCRREMPARRFSAAVWSHAVTISKVKCCCRTANAAVSLGSRGVTLVGGYGRSRPLRLGPGQPARRRGRLGRRPLVTAGASQEPELFWAILLAGFTVLPWDQAAAVWKGLSSVVGGHEGGFQDRQTARRQQRRADARQHAGDNQDQRAKGEPACRRGRGEPIRRRPGPPAACRIGRRASRRSAGTLPRSGCSRSSPAAGR
jgi:hypothetical protein